MPRASMLEDGSIAELHLKNSDGSSQVLRFQPDTFLGFLNRAIQMFFEAQTRKAAKSGHLESQTISIVASSAQESLGGKSVLLSVRMENGTPVSFSMQIAEAEELQKQLGLAAQKARHQSSSERH